MYNCVQCGETFQSYDVMKSHLEILHTGEDSSQYEPFDGQMIQCGSCELQFKSEEEFDAHIHGQHSLILECDQCNFVTRSFTEL